jgi:hypothetical protein
MEIINKFCDKINSKDRTVYFGEFPQLDKKFTSKLGAILSYSDINKDTLDKLKNDENQRICCMTECTVNAYIISDKITKGNTLSIGDIENFVTNEDTPLSEEITCWNYDGDDLILLGRKIKTEDIPNLRLETINIKLYQDVTELFKEITEIFLEEWDEDDKNLLKVSDEKSVYYLLEGYFDQIKDEFPYFVDEGGIRDQKAIGHTLSSFFYKNISLELAITSTNLMNDDDWYNNNYFQFYKLT